MKKILNNKVVNIVFSVIEWIICIVLIVLILLTGFQRFSNQGNFFGYRIYTVASGSMIPIYNIGDTLLIEEMEASEIKIGDAVTYLGRDSGVDGMIITHQVIDVEKDENGKYLFYTKGVANNVVDPVVSEEQVLGKVVHKFFFLSFLGRITTNMTSMLVFITIPIAFLIAIEIIKLVYKDDIEEIKSARDKEKNKKIDASKDDDSKEVEENNDVTDNIVVSEKVKIEQQETKE